MDPHSCTASVILPVPEEVTSFPLNPDKPYIMENCSGWSYTVRHRRAIDPNDCTAEPGLGDTKNIRQLPDGRYMVVNMQPGCNWIYYTFTDGCGNVAECTYDIYVEDDIRPTAVCHEHTVITLTSDGKAIVPATVFDDGSHDNCMLDRYLVRRMSGTACRGLRLPGNTNRDSIEFCCADIRRNPIRVILTVVDKNGNTSDCMVEAIIQDKLPPMITSCPNDTMVACTEDFSDLSRFGWPTAIDNCNVSIRDSVYRNLNNCNLGTIVRVFIATDDQGLTDTCRQTLTVYDPTPFRCEDIVWPRDTTIYGCSNSLDPDFLGRPSFLNQDACNQPVARYDDLVFNVVEGACAKILRTWTVIDWCTYNVLTGAGTWDTTQVIMLHDKECTGIYEWLWSGRSVYLFWMYCFPGIYSYCGRRLYSSKST